MSNQIFVTVEKKNHFLMTKKCGDETPLNRKISTEDNRLPYDLKRNGKN